jgi:stearoyl-CoA desaturase (delta-9 desaturase)
MTFDPYKQTLYVVWGNQILFLLASVFAPSLLMIPLAIIGLYVFGFMSEASVHRYFTHKSYTTTPFKEKILRVFALLSGQGATISWVTVHRTHHAYEDQPGDPHSPMHRSWIKILLGLFPNEYKKTIVIDLMRSPSWKYYVWENKYYWLIWTAVWAISFLINFYLFYFIVAGCAVWYLATVAVNIFNHTGSLGEKQYDDSVATNSKIMNFFTGAGHHNNHHKNPRSHTYSVDGEIDIYGTLIEKLFLVKSNSSKP